MKAWLTSWSGVVSIVVVSVAVGLTVAFVYRDSRDSSSSDRFAFTSRRVPGEFVYLDKERTRAYLAQVQGGLADSEARANVRGGATGVTLDTGTGLGGEVNVTTQETISRVVTPTEASDFLRLLEALANPSLQRPVRLRALDAKSTPTAFAEKLLTIKEGDFLRLDNAKLLIPVYAQPYDAVKRLGSARIVGNSLTTAPCRKSRPTGLRCRAIRYAKAFGANPRIVFNLGARDSMDGPPYERVGLDGKPHPGCPGDPAVWKALGGTWPQPPGDVPKMNARVIVPVDFALLSEEGSLTSGGTSTIVGKVVRLLREPVGDPTRKPRAVDVCYEDNAAFNQFSVRSGLLPPGLVRALRGVDISRVERSLLNDTRAIAPAAVVLPIAIYQ